MSTAQGAHDGGSGRTPSESVARGLMRPASLAVVTAFAAIGAALPLAFDHGGLVARTSRHAAVARHVATPGASLPGSGGDAGPVIAPVSADGFDAGSGILADAGPAPAATTGAPAAPAAPEQPSAATRGGSAPTPSPTPPPLLSIQTPSTPLGSAGVTVDGTSPTSPTSATVTVPIVGSTTVSNPLPSAPALP